jgi:hypothetical protein
VYVNPQNQHWHAFNVGMAEDIRSYMSNLDCRVLADTAREYQRRSISSANTRAGGTFAHTIELAQTENRLAQRCGELNQE